MILAVRRVDHAQEVSRGLGFEPTERHPRDDGREDQFYERTIYLCQWCGYGVREHRMINRLRPWRPLALKCPNRPYAGFPEGGRLTPLSQFVPVRDQVVRAEGEA